jgi:CDP-glycerol glycerophosphotransferase
MNEQQGAVNDLGRRFARRLPGPMQSGLRQLVRRIARAGSSNPLGTGPVLTVIVVAHNAASYLIQCMRSLQSQTLKAIEVIIVDSGSTDGTAAVADEMAAEDFRFRVLLRPPLSVTAARNAGVRVARGRFVAFVDATDTVPRTAYATLINSLRHTGSDFAAGSVRTVIRGRRHRPTWAALTHDLDRLALTIDDFPFVLHDTSPTNRVFRRDFWEGTVGGFPDSADGELFAVVSATLQARKFDLLQAITSIERPRLNPRKLLPDPLSVSELDSRLNWLFATWRLVHDSAGSTIAGGVLGRLIDHDLGNLAADGHRADDLYRARLQKAAQECLAMADDNVWPYVRVDRKLRLWLVANARWSDLDQLVQHSRLYGSIPRTEIRDGRLCAVAADLPGAAEAPLECLELGGSQTALSACVQRVDWWHDRLEVHGWAFIRGLDLAGETPRLEASLVEPVTGYSYPCEVTQLPRVAANEWSGFRYQDVAPGGFVIGIDSRLIDRNVGRWQLRLTVRAHGLERTGPIQAVAPGGAGHLMRGRNLHAVDDPNRVVPKLDPQLGFCLQVRPERARALALTTDGAGGAAGAIRLIDSGLGQLVSVVAASSLSRIATDLPEPDSEGKQSFELNLPVGSAGSLGWDFRAVDGHGREHRVSWPVEAEHSLQVGGGVGDAYWQRSITGYCTLMTDWAVAQAESVSVDDHEVSIELRLIGLDPSDCADARLMGRRAGVPARHLEPAEHGARLVFPLLAGRWGGPERPLPTDDYQIVLTSGARVLCSDELAARLPDEGLTGNHHYRLMRNNRTELLVAVASPLADDERSRVAEERLSKWYQRSSFTPSDSVLFQSYRGEFATDSQLAIHAELRNRRPDLDLVWGVADLSVAVPDGGRAMLIGSREWYEVLGSSRYLCRNIEFERYFRKRPYQRYLQTFHGYPFKSMGVSLWRVQGRSESVIANECARRGGTWDAIVVPESFCVDLYRREYRFTGSALVTGYPRNDNLVTADTAEVRSRVLAQLGIAEDRIVVLYAPTWRDTAATSPWTAKLFDGLDLEALAVQLGERYAVLLRGHNYNLREGHWHLADRVWDVSDYPEINDLLLAADVAVVDYSSIRFDWLVTGKPVIFFVPDLGDYLNSRTVLFDFPSTAPGPLLSTTAEVGEALLDLGPVVSEYAAARELFNKEFNRLHDGHATERVISAFF